MPTLFKTFLSLMPIETLMCQKNQSMTTLISGKPVEFIKASAFTVGIATLDKILHAKSCDLCFDQSALIFRGCLYDWVVSARIL